MVAPPISLLLVPRDFLSALLHPHPQRVFYSNHFLPISACPSGHSAALSTPLLLPTSVPRVQPPPHPTPNVLYHPPPTEHDARLLFIITFRQIVLLRSPRSRAAQSHPPFRGLVIPKIFLVGLLIQSPTSFLRFPSPPLKLISFCRHSLLYCSFFCLFARPSIFACCEIERSLSQEEVINDRFFPSRVDPHPELPGPG